MIFNSATVESVSTGFRSEFLDGYGSAVTWQQYCMVLDSVHSQETIVIPEGLGDLELWKGSRTIDTPILWDQTIKNKTFQKSFGVPREAYEDDQLGVYKAQARMLGIAAATHPEALLSEILVAGFTTNTYDGVPFFSASHPRGNGLAAQSNLASGALASGTFRTALAQLTSFTDYYGKPLNLKAMGFSVKLICGPSNRATAKSIVAMQTTASGAGNPDYGEADVEINERLIGDYAGYWFLALVGGPIQPFIFLMRRKPELIVVTNPESEEVLKNNRIIHATDYRGNIGHGFFQLIQGSTGA